MNTRFFLKYFVNNCKIIKVKSVKNEEIIMTITMIKIIMTITMIKIILTVIITIIIIMMMIMRNKVDNRIKI